MNGNRSDAQGGQRRFRRLSRATLFRLYVLVPIGLILLLWIYFASLK